MEKSQILPNRKEWRASMRRFKHLRVIKKTKTKGVFGKLSEYMIQNKKKHDLKKAEKLNLKNAKFTEPTETKPVTKEKTQPDVTKEIKDVEFNGVGMHLKKEEKEVKKPDAEPVETKEVKEKKDE